MAQPIDISGYNKVFRSFVTFAEGALHTEKGAKSIANAQVLGGRTVSVVATDADKTGFSGGFHRTHAAEQANDATRNLFIQSVIAMFGGEKNIPKTVMKALKTEDYYCGKPLTARRILAVSKAIDQTGILIDRAKAAMKTASMDLYAKAFAENKELMAQAKKLGFTAGETPKLAKAVLFASKALGISEADALKNIGTPGSKENRLYEYGGRFLKSATNFQHGLRLLDEFKAWYDRGKAWYFNHKAGLEIDFSSADTVTKLNGGVTMFDSKFSELGLEAMIFEELASDGRYSLSSGTPEELFGFANNPASRFFGREFHKTAFGTMANIPPQKRYVVFAAFDAFALMAGDRASARDMLHMPAEKFKIRNNSIHIARILKNFDAIKALVDAGQLTAKDVVKICYPEIKKPGKNMLKAVNDFTNFVEDEIERELGFDKVIPVRAVMQNTGCTLSEAIAAYREKRTLPFAPYVTGYSFALNEYNKGGRAQVINDLTRGYNYSTCDANGEALQDQTLLGAKDFHYGVAFGDGTAFKVSGDKNLKGNADKVVDKIVKLCGQAHVKQANVVLYNLTQSANVQLNRGLLAHGIHSVEHAVVNYEVTRDDKTGAVTVRTYSPEALPVKFEWKTTVDVNGNCVSTPMTVTAK